MWNDARTGAAVLLVTALAGWGLVAGWRQAPPRELTRADVDVRAGVIFPRGKPESFRGRLVESYPSGKRKLSIEIRQGRAHGGEPGWYENGQTEVEEHFVRGVSSGRRTRWYADGAKRSTVAIVDGRLSGLYEEWHPDGKKALEITYRDGLPEGVARAWTPDGGLKSELFYRAGALQPAR